jgi:hypothetical protein
MAPARMMQNHLAFILRVILLGELEHVNIFWHGHQKIAGLPKKWHEPQKKAAGLKPGATRAKPRRYTI